MSFDNDASKQVAAIRANIATCAQTVALDQAAMLSLLEKHIAGRKDVDLSLDDVRLIQDLLSNFAVSNGMFFKGTHFAGKGKKFYNTRPEVRVKRCLMSGLKVMGLSITDADEVAERLMDDLTDPGQLLYQKSHYGGLPVHWHGYPVWLALPDGGVEPSSQVDVLPARLGLAPEKAIPVRYVLMTLSAADCHLPRFADSCGYPYWAPGGITKPIEQCPAGLTGIGERVADGLRLSDLCGPYFYFMRTV
jgi:hypothetical protein